MAETIRIDDLIHNNKWCLSKTTLNLLIDDGASFGGFVESSETIKYLNEVGDEISIPSKVARLPLRSSISDKVFYEILRVRRRDSTDIFILEWNEDKSKYACVYKNDRIVRWGAWAVELLRTLPALTANLCRHAADLEVGPVLRSIQEEKVESDGFSVIEMELALGWDNSILNISHVYGIDMGGVHLDSI